MFIYIYILHIYEEKLFYSIKFLVCETLWIKLSYKKSTILSEYIYENSFNVQTKLAENTGWVSASGIL